MENQAGRKHFVHALNTAKAALMSYTDQVFEDTVERYHNLVLRQSWNDRNIWEVTCCNSLINICTEERKKTCQVRKAQEDSQSPLEVVFLNHIQPHSQALLLENMFR